MAKRKGKVQRGISDERKQAIVLSAASTSRVLGRVSAVLVVIFIATLGYLGVRAAIAALGHIDVTVEAPEPFDTALTHQRQPERLANSLTPTIDAEDRAALTGQGFDVLGANELRDTRSLRELAREAAGPTPSAGQRRQFEELWTVADDALQREMDYGKAVQTFREALAITAINPFDRERAVRGLDRAMVNFDLMHGVQALTADMRLVRYTPPGGEPFVVAVPAGTRQLTGDRLVVQRLDDDTLVEIVPTGWQAEPLDAAATRVALTERLAGIVARVAALKEAGACAPADICRAGLTMKRTGDLPREDGRLLSGTRTAHACLGEAFDACDAAASSLAHTVLLNRDPEFAHLIERLVMLTAVRRQMQAASRSELPALQRVEQGCSDLIDEALVHLQRRYPRAWLFRNHASRSLLGTLREHLVVRAGEGLPSSLAAAPLLPLETPPSGVADVAGFHVERAQIARNQARQVLTAIVAPGYNRDQLYRDASAAIEQCRRARAGYEAALEALPGHPTAASQAREVTGTIWLLEQLLPLAR